MRAAHSRYDKKNDEFPSLGEQFEYADVCRLSGMLPGEACPHTKRELFIRGTVPQCTCNMHVLLRIDKSNGLLAGPGCTEDEVRWEKFEVFAGKYARWAKQTHRKVAPRRWSPRCPGSSTDHPDAQRGERLRIRYPYDGAIFLLDPSMPKGSQGIVVRAEAPHTVQSLAVFIDGKRVATIRPPFELPIDLKPGEHRVWVMAGTRKSQPVRFLVR